MDGQGSLDADEFREMLPLLSGEHLPFERVEELFEQVRVRVRLRARVRVRVS